jgi:hypothetical protein
VIFGLVAKAGKERGLSSLSPGMRPLSLGWFFVTVWGIVCVLLALAIVFLVVLA